MKMQLERLLQEIQKVRAKHPLKGSAISNPDIEKPDGDYGTATLTDDALIWLPPDQCPAGCGAGLHR